MNDEMIRFMAKTNPKSLKSIIDIAKYGNLQERDTLTIGEIAELWSKEGIKKETPEWKMVVTYLAGLVGSDSLRCDQKEIALGGLNKETAWNEAILRGFKMQSSFSGDKYYKPCNAKILRDDLKQFLDKNEGWGPINNFLIRRWWSTEINSGEEREHNPLHTGKPKHLNKDREALKALEKIPELRHQTKKAEIKKILQDYKYNVFIFSYEDWWRTQDIFPKEDRGGRPPSTNKEKI